MKQFLELSDIPRILDQRIKECGGLYEFCRQHTFYDEYIKNVLNPEMIEECTLSNKLFAVLNLRRVSVYERIEG